MTFLTKTQRWNPFDELATLRNELDRLSPRFTAPETDEMFASRWAPATDIIETPDALVMKTELPGLTDKDVSVEIENGMITIRGERKHEEETKDKGYLRVERSYGKFVRTFALPNDVEIDKINATFDNGLLELTIPRKAEARPKTVRLNVKPVKAAAA
jgi:HSP20 family protein